MIVELTPYRQSLFTSTDFSQRFLCFPTFKEKYNVIEDSRSVVTSGYTINLLTTNLVTERKRNKKRSKRKRPLGNS